MARFIKKRLNKIGTAPGSLIFVGEQKMVAPEIRVIVYSADHIEEFEQQQLADLPGHLKGDNKVWIDVRGIHDPEYIRQIGELFELHPLLQEAVMNTGQRPMFEEFENCFFMVLKMLQSGGGETIDAEQFSMVVTERVLITFQEKPGDVFEPVRGRLRQVNSRLRQRTVDYLCYALVDTIIDQYVVLIERFGERIEEVEDRIISGPQKDVLQAIYANKQEINFLRKVVRPVRECVLQFIRSESELIHTNTQPFLHNLEPLIMLASESIETYRDLLSDQLNIYETTTAGRLNEIMRVLTIFSVIFIPLTFIAGIYGTNFEYFPELKWQYAYPTFWAVLLGTAGLMVWYFRRKNWL